MLNLNKVGRPIARINKGKYNNMVVSVTEQFQNDDDKEEKDGLMKEFRRLRISNDSFFFNRLQIQQLNAKFYMSQDVPVVVNQHILGNLLKN